MTTKENFKTAIAAREELLKTATGANAEARTMVNQLREYEHGTADVKDIHSRLSLVSLQRVYEDLALTLLYSE